MALKYLYVPSGYKGGGSSGTAYGVLPNEAAADLDFVRSSSATRINENGLVETMGANVPRLDYTDGSCPTLLTEPESTNLVRYSEDFSQWVKLDGGTGIDPVVSTGFSAPDGSSNARKVVFNKGAGNTFTDRSFLDYSYTSVASTYTQTIWLRVESGTANIFVDFDSTSSNVVTLNTNWQRITLTKAGVAGNRQVRFGLRGSVGVDDTATVLAWGAQLEEQPYATSYIYNNGTVLGVTRSADTGVVSGDLSSYINSSEGVLEIKAKALFNGGSDVRITLSDGTNNNRVGLAWLSSANNTSLIMQKDATTIVSANLNVDQTEMATFKIKWKSGDIQAKVNGAIVFTSTNSFSGLVLNQLVFGKGSASNPFEGNVQYIKVYDSITDF
jgi:hypothetical protein